MGNLKYENDQLKEQLSGEEGATLRRNDKELFRKMKGELKDYETYKDVMEQTFQRMKRYVILPIRTKLRRPRTHTQI